ncbi:MAG: hypothetical protein JKY52_09675 [Flavobacteriales bacterium]|nr:hypothetical protein [Flavobacteriales bacterium]
MTRYSIDIEQYLIDDIETLRDTKGRIEAILFKTGGVVAPSYLDALYNVTQAIRILEDGEYND